MLRFGVDWSEFIKRLDIVKISEQFFRSPELPWSNKKHITIPFTHPNPSMKTIRLAIVSLAAVFGSLLSFAQQTQADAFVSSIVGSAMVVVPGATEAVPVVIGQKLPEGSTVTTAEGASVLIQSHEGIQTGVGAKSSVVVGAHSVSSDGVRTAVIDLKEGTTVSVLDPAKRSVNNYAIRTPKGVAAARGTTYSTNVKLASGGEAIVTVNTTTGAVSFSIVGGATVSVTEGRSMNSSKAGATTIAEAITSASSPEEAQAITEALQATVAVASIVANAAPQIGDAPGSAQTTLTAVVRAVTGAANQIAQTDQAAAQALVTTTVITVREYAGDSSNQVVNQISAASSPALKSTVTTAAAAPVEVKTVTLSQGNADTPVIISAPVTNTPTQTTIDITIVSPNS